MNLSFGRNRLSVSRHPWSSHVGFVLFARQGDRMVYSTDIVMHTPEDPRGGGETIDPTFSLAPEETQELMDELWQLGFRPSEGSGSAGALAATQKHLEDMRKIVFEHLGIK
jgi:hypothetical protein